MHILTGLHDARNTPAHVLYDEWKRALEAWNGSLRVDLTNQAIQYGVSPNMGIGVVDNVDNTDNDRHAIGFGYVGNRYLSPWLIIAANGEFRFNYKRYGWQQRDHLTRNTFLSWRYAAREYVWRISDDTQGSYSEPDWRDQFHYVGEKTMGLGRGGSAWMRTQLVNNEWVLKFSRPAHNAQSYGVAPTQDDFDRFDRLRERRYRSSLRQHQIATGVINPAKPRTRLTPEEEQERFDKAAASLAGLMPVTTRPTNFKQKESA